MGITAQPDMATLPVLALMMVYLGLARLVCIHSGSCKWVIQPSSTWHTPRPSPHVMWLMPKLSPACSTPTLALLSTSGCWRLAESGLAPDSDYMNAHGHYRLAQPGPTTLALTLTSGRCCLPGKSPVFPYQAGSQSWILCSLAGTLIQPAMTYPQS